MEKPIFDHIKKCEICNSNATCLWFSCNSYYCENCYKTIHDLKKELKHKKDIFDPFVPIDLKCPEHPEYPMHFFCIEEKGKYINFY